MAKGVNKKVCKKICERYKNKSCDLQYDLFELVTKIPDDCPYKTVHLLTEDKFTLEDWRESLEEIKNSPPFQTEMRTDICVPPQVFEDIKKWAEEEKDK